MSNSEFYSEKYYLDDIKRFSTTKKSLVPLNKKKYTFLVNPIMDKVVFKFTIEKSLNVRVRKVNTIRLPAEKRIVRKYSGYRSKLKKIVITLDPDDQIKLFSDL